MKPANIPALNSEMFYRDPTGAWHKATVIEPGKVMSVIGYWDNTRRGIRTVAGRNYNHGTYARGPGLQPRTETVRAKLTGATNRRPLWQAKPKP